MVYLESSLCGEACGKLEGNFIRTACFVIGNIVNHYDVCKEAVCKTEIYVLEVIYVKRRDLEVLSADTVDGHVAVLEALGGCCGKEHGPGNGGIAEINVIGIDNVVIRCISTGKSIAVNAYHCGVGTESRLGVNTGVGISGNAYVLASVNYELYGVGNVLAIINGVGVCNGPIDLGAVSLNYPACGIDKIFYVNGRGCDIYGELIGSVLTNGKLKLGIVYGCYEVVNSVVRNVLNLDGACVLSNEHGSIFAKLIPVDGNGGICSVIGVISGESVCKRAIINNAVVIVCGCNDSVNGKACSKRIKLNVSLGHFAYNVTVCVNPSKHAFVISEEVNVCAGGKEAANNAVLTVVIGYLIDILKLNREVKTYGDGITVIKYVCYCKSYCTLCVINDCVEDIGVCGSVLINYALNLAGKLILVNGERLINEAGYLILGNGDALVCVELIGCGIIEVCDALVHVILGHVGVYELNENINSLIVLSLILADPLDILIGIESSKVIVYVELLCVLLNEVGCKKSLEVDSIENLDDLCEGKLLADEELCILTGLIKSCKYLVLKIIGNLIGLYCKTDDLCKLIGNNEINNESVVCANAYVNVLGDDCHRLLNVSGVSLEAYVDIKLEGLEAKLCLDNVVEEVCELLGSVSCHLAGSGDILDELLCKIKVKVEVKTVESYKLFVGLSVPYGEALEGKEQILYITCGDNGSKRLALLLSGNAYGNVGGDGFLDAFAAGLFDVVDKLLNNLGLLLLGIINLGKNLLYGIHLFLNGVDNALEFFNDLFNVHSLVGILKTLRIFVCNGLKSGLYALRNVGLDLVLKSGLIVLILNVLIECLGDRLVFLDLNAESGLKKLFEKLHVLITYALGGRK